MIILLADGTPETGLWCPVCLLPSRVCIPLFTTTEAGGSPLGVYDACQDCGWSPARSATGSGPPGP